MSNGIGAARRWKLWCRKWISLVLRRSLYHLPQNLCSRVLAVWVRHDCTRFRITYLLFLKKSKIFDRDRLYGSTSHVKFIPIFWISSLSRYISVENHKPTSYPLGECRAHTLLDPAPRFAATMGHYLIQIRNPKEILFENSSGQNPLLGPIGEYVDLRSACPFEYFKKKKLILTRTIRFQFTSSTSCLGMCVSTCVLTACVLASIPLLVHHPYQWHQKSLCAYYTWLPNPRRKDLVRGVFTGTTYVNASPTKPLKFQQKRSSWRSKCDFPILGWWQNLEVHSPNCLACVLVCVLDMTPCYIHIQPFPSFPNFVGCTLLPAKILS